MAEKKKKPHGAEIAKTPEQQFFAHVLTRLDGALQDPLIPVDAQQDLLGLLRGGHTSMTSDENFILKQAARLSVAYPQQEAIALAREASQHTNAVYMRPKGNSKVGNIYMRESEVRSAVTAVQQGILDPQRAEDNITELLLEEFGHSLYINYKIPLTAISDHSAFLLPFLTKEEYIAYYQKVAEEKRQNGITIPDFSEADIDIDTLGFACMPEIRGYSHIFFGRDRSQIILEETRASVVQTLLAIITYGREDFDNGNYENVASEDRNKYVFGLGVQAIKNRVAALALKRSEAYAEAMYIREIPSLRFLQAYFQYYGINIENIDTMDSQHLTEHVGNLFSMLSKITFDELLDQPTVIKDAFNNIIEGARNEFDGRRRFLPF